MKQANDLIRIRELAKSIADSAICIQDDCYDMEDLNNEDELIPISSLVDSLRYKINTLYDLLKSEL